MEIELLGEVGGWMIARQPDGVIIGIIWSDGNYYAECLVDKTDKAYHGELDICYIPSEAHIRGTI